MSINRWGSDDPMQVSKGGLGAATHTDGGVLFGSGTSAVTNSGALAKGSILVGDGTTDPTERTAGTDAHILYADSTQSDGVKYAAIDPANKRALLETITISNDASVTTSATIDSTYIFYEIVLSDIIPATDGVYMDVQFNESGGSLLTSALYSNKLHGEAVNNQNVDLQEASQTQIQISPKGNSVDHPLSNVASEPFSATIRIYTPSDANTQPVCKIKGTSWDQNTLLCGYHGGFGYASNKAIDAVKFLMTSGNITSGTIKVYGIW